MEGERGSVNSKIQSNGPMILIVQNVQRNKVPVNNSVGEVSDIRVALMWDVLLATSKVGSWFGVDELFWIANPLIVLPCTDEEGAPEGTFAVHVGS